MKWEVERLWYLALQDGRYSDNDYAQYEDAKAALLEINEDSRRGICIMSYDKKVDK